MEAARAVLRGVFGHPAFRPLQEGAIEAALAGRDALVVLPTGGGKSVCYQVPAVVRHRETGLKTLVVSPLVALMDDQVAALTAAGVPAVALHRGSAPSAEELARAVLIYASPERLARPAARAKLYRLGIGAVAVDEAHCVSAWGHDFRPEYAGLGVLKAELGAPVLALTATADARVREEIAASLGLREPLVIVGDFRRPNLAFRVEHHRGDQARLAAAVAWLDRLGLGRGGPGRAVVYAATRKRVDDAAKALRAAGFEVAHYHAGRTGGAREKAAAAFAEGDRGVMVATTAFGMGIDHPDVRLVLHLQAPGSLAAYVQESGRAGRDGEPAHAVLLYGPSDALTQARLRGRSPAPGAEAGWKALQDYAFAEDCRQQRIARWFDAAEGPPCGRCDACVDGASVRAVVEGAREASAARRAEVAAKVAAAEAVTLSAEQESAILAFVGAMARPAGRALVAGALRGSAAAGVRRLKLDANPHHGALRGVPEVAVVAAIDRMLADGRLVRKGRKYPTVWAAGRPVRSAAPAGAARTPRASRYTGLARALSDWRRREARRKGWKPYQIFQNRTLEALASAQPVSVDEVAAVPGMGTTRAERYGEALVALIRRWQQEGR